MKKWIIIFPLVLFFGCNNNKEEGLSYLNPEVAKDYFAAVENICNADSGRLWGENIYGPIMLVDVVNRTIYANAPDKNGLLKLKEGVYTGTLLKEKSIIVNNVEYGGTLYAMVPMPMKEDHYRIVSWAVHSLYHCFQERNNLRRDIFNVSHLNDNNSRLLLKLEWKALEKAINTDSLSRKNYIRDALIFRGARRELYPYGIKDENTFECMEGLATFTYIKLCASNEQEYKDRILEFYKKIYKSYSYTASYGFIHGALYAFLLDARDYDFSSIKKADFDLASETGKIYEISLPDYCRDVAGSIALAYNISDLQNEELEMQRQIRSKTKKIASDFTEKPTIKIFLESPNFCFEPEDIFSLDTIGTIYHKLRVSDNWGKLSVDGGTALISFDLKTIWLKKEDITNDRNHIYGEGWHITINEGWKATEEGENISISRPVVN